MSQSATEPAEEVDAENASDRGVRTGRYMALSSLTDLLTTAVAFGTGLLVARYLGPHDRGVYSLVTTVGMLLAFAVGMGQFESLLARGAGPSRGHFRAATALGLAGAALMVGIAWVTGEPLFAAYAAFPLLWNIMQIRLARAALDQDWSWIYLRALPNAVQISITAGLWISGHLTLTLALAAMLLGLGATLTLDRALNGAILGTTSVHPWRAILHGAPHHMLNLPRMTNYRGPILVLGMLATPAEVGRFAVASAVGSLVPSLTWSLTQNLLVLTAKGSSQAARAQRALTVAGYASSIGASVLLAWAGSWVLSVLYGEQYADTWPALVIVLASQGLWLHSGLVQVRYRAAGLAHRAAAIECTGIIVMVVVMLATGGAGYLSAAYGTAATCATTLILSLVWASRDHRLRP